MRALRKPLLVLITIVVAIAAFTYLGRQVDWAVLARFTLAQNLILCATSLAIILIHAMGTATLLRAMGYHAPFFKLMKAMVAAATVCLAGDPKLGIPMRLFFYRVFARIPLNLGVTQILAESILWVLIMALIIAIPSPGGSEISLLFSAGAMVAIAMGIGGIIVGPTLLRHLWLVRHLFSPANRLGRFVLSVRETLLGLQPKQGFMAVGWYIGTYVVDVLTIWYLLTIFGYHLNGIVLAHVIVLSYVAGALSMLPLGLGVRDVTFSLLLHQLGVSVEDAAACAIIYRTIRTAVPLALCGIMAPWIFSGFNSRKATNSPD